MIPRAERNACIGTCLAEFPYTPYELEMQRRRAAYLQATQEATAASNAAAARAAPGPTPGGGKNRKSRKTRRRSIRR